MEKYTIIKYIQVIIQFNIIIKKFKFEIFNAYIDKLIFEGEYNYGKRNGKGKEYNLSDHLKFEGEYLNGKIYD